MILLIRKLIFIAILFIAWTIFTSDTSLYTTLKSKMKMFNFNTKESFTNGDNESHTGEYEKINGLKAGELYSYLKNVYDNSKPWKDEDDKSTFRKWRKYTNDGNITDSNETKMFFYKNKEDMFDAYTEYTYENVKGRDKSFKIRVGGNYNWHEVIDGDNLNKEYDGKTVKYKFDNSIIKSVSKESDGEGVTVDVEREHSPTNTEKFSSESISYHIADFFHTCLNEIHFLNRQIKHLQMVNRSGEDMQEDFKNITPVN